MQNFDDLGEIAYAQSKKNSAQISDIANQVNSAPKFEPVDDWPVDPEEGVIYFKVVLPTDPEEPIDPTLNYYTEGTENVEWIQAYTLKNAICSKEADHLFLETTDNPTDFAEVTFSTTSPVDLTNINTIYFEYESLNAHDSFSMRFAVALERDTGNSSSNLALYVDAAGIDSRSTASIDVTALTGNYYIRVSARDSTNTESRPGQLKVYNVWGELDA